MPVDITIKELARITGRHEETLRRLARMGRLPGAYRLGRKWNIRAGAVNRLRGKHPKNLPKKKKT